MKVRSLTWKHWEHERSWCGSRPTRPVLTRVSRDVTNGDMEIRFQSADGTPLVGTLFEAANPRGAVLIGGATGVLARFYEPFAQWLAEERGYTTMTFDFRGIGRSLTGRLADSEATKVDWAAQDLPAALDALAEHAPGLPLHLVGNSGGGQLIGCMHNARKLERVVQVGSSSGHLKFLARPLRYFAPILMKGWMPLSNRLFGYAVAKTIGWGEDLPRGVARQWTEWCSTPGYVESALGREIPVHHYFDMTPAILNLSFTDDPIATAHNVEDLLRLFPKAEITRRRIAPAEVGMKEVGHVGFFRRNAKALWPIAGDFLDAQPIATQAVPSRGSAGRSAQSG